MKSDTSPRPTTDRKLQAGVVEAAPHDPERPTYKRAYEPMKHKRLIRHAKRVNKDAARRLTGLERGHRDRLRRRARDDRHQRRRAARGERGRRALRDVLLRRHLSWGVVARHSCSVLVSFTMFCRYLKVPIGM